MGLRDGNGVIAGAGPAYISEWKVTLVDIGFTKGIAGVNDEALLINSCRTGFQFYIDISVYKSDRDNL